jgi:asparagine synthetase A
MDEKQILQRKIKLKRQAIVLIRAEAETLKQRLSLFRVRDSLLNQMGSGFDRNLSTRLDAVDFLLSF